MSEPALLGSLSRIAAAIGDDASFALVGGLAVSVWAEPRLTRDCDLAISVDDDPAAEALVLDLTAAGYAAVTVVEHEATGRLATVRLQHPADEGRYVDLLFASSGIEREIVAGALRRALSRSLTLPVASVGHLVAMKLLSVDIDRRPLDRADLISLADVATPDDWATAADAVALIEARGFHRGRDLSGAVARLREDGLFRSSTSSGPVAAPGSDELEPE